MRYLTVISLLVFIMAMPVSAHQDPLAKKSPILASALSVCMIGGGQFYNNQISKGAMFYGVGMLGLGTFIFSATDDYSHGYDADQDNGMGLVGVAIWSIAITASAFEAYHAAKKINARIERFEVNIKPYASPEAKGAVLSLRF